jgi:hypothetical protein
MQERQRKNEDRKKALDSAQISMSTRHPLLKIQVPEVGSSDASTSG